jgi:hypothetical protein
LPDQLTLLVYQTPAKLPKYDTERVLKFHKRPVSKWN